MADWITSDDLPELIKPGCRVYVGGSSGEPKGLLSQLNFAENIHFTQMPIGALNQQDISALGTDCSLETFFMTPYLKEGVNASRVHYIPMHMRAVYEYIASTRIDVALLLAAPDANGDLRYSACTDFLGAVLGNAKITIVEVSDSLISPLGSLLVGNSADFLFASHTPQAIFLNSQVDATSKAIGKNVADLIRDGDCLQTGVGATPSAILLALDEKNDLGLHSGLIDDTVMRLIANGNMNGACKNIDRKTHIAGMAIGSSELHAWLQHKSSVQFRSTNYTHEISVINQLDNFVSLNSAIEIDLYGQVNAEVIAGQQISGTGGSVDFMRAARSSKGGRSIIAMSATARAGTESRVVPKVEIVTASRTDVDIVVTEFGVAELRNASLDERAQKLIQVAHPEFRDRLREKRVS